MELWEIISVITSLCSIIAEYSLAVCIDWIDHQLYKCGSTCHHHIWIKTWIYVRRFISLCLLTLQTLQGSCDSFSNLQYSSSVYGNWLHMVSQASQGDVGRVEFWVPGGMGTPHEVSNSWSSDVGLGVVGLWNSQFPNRRSRRDSTSCKHSVVSNRCDTICGKELLILLPSDLTLYM